jgi:hypothetical protein
LILSEHQIIAVEKLRTGSILVGGVGTGKSRTSLLYFYTKVLNGKVNPLVEPKKWMDLYIITTARKRDTKEWEMECCFFDILNNSNMTVVVDSWNNIEKYADVKNAFFIFDEQRVVGSGVWAKTFIKIAKKNDWILLSATPGDTYTDYIPVLIANGYFKNRVEFMRKHVVYKPFMKYPVIDHYVGTAYLEKCINDILVLMPVLLEIVKHDIYIKTEYDKALYMDIVKNRWNPWKEEPIGDASGLSQALRRVVNSDESRINETVKIVNEKQKCIIFYNFDYELELLRQMCKDNKFTFAEWNGHKHQSIPETKSWVYLVHYSAGAEGWNCIITNTIIFYSQNHSYKLMTQAAGRIERMNTPFKNLYYYRLMSDANIDKAIAKCLKEKKDFNEHRFVEEDEVDEFAEKYGM